MLGQLKVCIHHINMLQHVEKYHWFYLNFIIPASAYMMISYQLLCHCKPLVQHPETLSALLRGKRSN